MDSERERCLVRDCDPVDGAWTAWSRDEMTEGFFGQALCPYSIERMLHRKWGK